MANFQTAEVWLNRGYRVARRSWKPDRFVFERPADEISVEILACARSLPSAVCTYFGEMDPTYMVNVSAYWCYFHPLAGIVNEWQPLGEDFEATDWYLPDH